MPEKIPQGHKIKPIDDAPFELPGEETAPVHECSGCGGLTGSTDDKGRCDFCATDHA